MQTPRKGVNTDKAMANKLTTNIERVIAKIDNDFNPDNSDWIPRVAAWTIDALNSLKVLRKVPKCTKLKVRNRIATSPCCPDGDDLRVFDNNGCEIKRLHNDRCGTNDCAGEGCPPSTGGFHDHHHGHGCNSHSHDHHDHDIHGCHTCHPHHHPHYDDCGFEIDHPHHHCDCHVGESHTRELINPHLFPDRELNWTEHTGSYDYRCMHQVHSTRINALPPTKRNFVVQGNNIELNFDTDSITISQLQVETEYSEYFGSEVPKIPDNGILIEAITQWCMYKMLTRGYKHPVMNLTAASPALNPYVAWTQLSQVARRSVRLDEQGVIRDDGSWRNAMYNYTFNPRG